MKRAGIVVIAAASTLMWTACDQEIPTQPLQSGPSFAIFVAKDFFHWLPPMVSQPTTSGTFVGNLSPAVEICVLGGEPLNCVRPIRSFSMASGVEVDVNGQHYQVNWNTKDTPEGQEPITTGDYRISVLLGPPPEGLLGFADVHIDMNAKQFKDLDQTIGLIDGSTLPIKFRIEAGVAQLPIFDIAYHALSGAAPDNPYASDVFVYSRSMGASLNLTNSPGTMDATPSWSPDGMRIAFASDRANVGGQPDIYVMHLGDGTIQRLTTAGGWKPAWNQDGTAIAFQRGWPPEPPPGTSEDSPLGRQHDIWVMNSDGSGQTQLTDVGHPFNEDPYEDIDPTWNMMESQSPSVTFARSDNDPYGNCPPLADGEDPDDPNPLPPGSLDTCDFDIVSKGVGSNAAFQHNHTRTRNIDQLSPAWRRDGNGLLFTQKTDPDTDLSVLVVRSPSGPLYVGDGMVNQGGDWSWDGNEILFERGPLGGTLALYVIAYNGSGWSSPQMLIPNAMWGRYRPLPPPPPAGD